MPERQQLEHIQTERDAHFELARAALFLVGKQLVQLEIVQIRQFELVAAAQRTLTAVARDEAPSARELGDGQRAVVGAHAAPDRVGLVGEVCKLLRADERGLLRAVCHRVQCRTVGAHQTGDRRTGDIASDLHLERAQNRVVEEGAALYDDVLAEVVRRMRADNLI